MPVADGTRTARFDDEDGGAGRGVRLVLDPSWDGEDRALRQDDRAFPLRFAQADVQFALEDQEELEATC